MGGKGLSRTYLAATIDSILNTPGAFDGAVDPRWFFTPKGRARKVHALVHSHGDDQPGCVAIDQIADTIRDAVEFGQKRYSEFLEYASEFYLRGPKTDFVISIRSYTQYKEGIPVCWVVHEAGKPKRFLNTWGDWEKETRWNRNDDAFVNRTRMSASAAFIAVKRLLAAQRSS